MKTQKMLLVIIYVLGISVSMASQCPHPEQSDWETKNSNCSKDSTGKRYHCQRDATTNLQVDMCAQAVNCTPGTHALLDVSSKTVSCIPCSPDMFQPKPKLSYMFTQPNCDERITPCGNDELTCGQATASENYQCMCDYRQGWRPENPNDVTCACSPKHSSSCTCQKAYCQEGEILYANYSCITDPSRITTTQVPGMSQQTMIGIIVGVILAVIVIATVILVIYIFFVRKRKKRTLNESSEKGTDANLPLSEPAHTNEDDTEARVTASDLPKETEEDTDKEVEAELPLLPPDKIEKVQETPDDDLYNKVKVMFVESVNPKDFVYRVALPLSEEERITEFSQREGREAGAGLLLQTVRRIYRDDWYERIVRVLKEPNVGLEHVAEKMEEIKVKTNQ